MQPKGSNRSLPRLFLRTARFPSLGGLALSLGTLGGCSSELESPNEFDSSGGTDGAQSPSGGSSASGGATETGTGGAPSSGGSPMAVGGSTGSAPPGDDLVGSGGVVEPAAGGSDGAGGEEAAGGADASGGMPSELPKFVGNITTGWPGSADTTGRVYSDYWDQITPENMGKWGSVQGNINSARNWGSLDALYDYAEEKGIIFKQHAFVWGSQQPSGDITEEDVKSWMQEFCDRYPNTRLIDVVNEPPPHTTPHYADAIGGGTGGSWQWIANSFKWAREACPNAILIFNDYNNIEYADQNQHFIDITNTIVAAGAPVDALGAQAHGLSGNVSAQTMKDLLTRLHTETGLPVYVTEYDISEADDTAQLNKFKEHFPFFMETEWIHGVTVWGWIYGSTWVPSSGLIRDGQPRPAMDWLMETLGRTPP